MSRTLNAFRIILLIFMCLVVIGGLLWANILFSRDHPGEKDFFVPWLAARTFLRYGDNPYGIPASQRAQVIFYGHLAANGQDPLRLGVPFPLELFYFPFAMVPDYAFARGLWMTCLEIALFALASLSVTLTNWRPARTLLPVIFIFSEVWTYGFLAVIGSGSVIFVSLAIVGSLHALRNDHDEAAGALLVLPFFMLDVVAPISIFLFFWAIYHRRARVVAGFLMTFVILMAVSFFILPGWFIPYIGGFISHYTQQLYLNPGGIIALFLPAIGSRLGWVLTGMVLMVLIFEWKNSLKQEFRHLLWTASLALAATPFLGLPFTLQDSVLLFFPLILVLSILAERWSRPKGWDLAGFSMIAIFVCFWIITASAVSASNFNSQIAGLVLGLPFLLVLGLYWMRWWAVRPPRTWRDSLP